MTYVGTTSRSLRWQRRQSVSIANNHRRSLIGSLLNELELSLLSTPSLEERHSNYTALAADHHPPGPSGIPPTVGLPLHKHKLTNII